MEFDAFPVIETERMILREFRMEDAGPFFELRTDEAVMEFMDREPLQSMEEAEKMLADTIDAFEQGAKVSWALTLKGKEEMIGYASFWKWEKAHFWAETGYALRQPYWGKGLMYEALEAVIGFGFGMMDLHRIVGDVNPNNIASIKLLEKLGFQKEAHFRENVFFRGAFLDSIIYARITEKKKL